MQLREIKGLIVAAIPTGAYCPSQGSYMVNNNGKVVSTLHTANATVYNNCEALAADHYKFFSNHISKGYRACRLGAVVGTGNKDLGKFVEVVWFSETGFDFFYITTTCGKRLIAHKATIIASLRTLGNTTIATMNTIPRGNYLLSTMNRWPESPEELVFGEGWAQSAVATTEEWANYLAENYIPDSKLYVIPKYRGEYYARQSTKS